MSTNQNHKEEATFYDGEIVAVYCRVSTDSDDQINSLENQKTYFANFAKDKHLKIQEIYFDEGLTGTSWKKRDGFNDMLKAAGLDVIKEIDRHTLKTKVSYSISKKRTPKFSKILIKNTSRFARNVLSIELVKMLRQNDVFIYFLDQRLITTVNNDFILNLFMNFDENDSRDKSIKVRFGFREGARKGMVYLGGGKLFGYDYHPKTNTLTKNKDAEVVKLIFDLYTEQRLGIRVIANKLKELGYKPPKGGDEWGKTSIRNILGNEKYAGKNPIQKFDGGMILEDKHWSKVRENYEIQDTDKIEPIITWEQFQKAKELREGKAVKYDGQVRGRKLVYSRYAKMVKCSNCGSFYIRNTDYRTKQKRQEDKYFFYNCAGKKKFGLSYCSNRNVLETELDELIKSLSYGGLYKHVKSRIEIFRWWLINLAQRLTKAIDFETDVTARVLQKKLDKEKQALKQMYKNLLLVKDDLGIAAEAVKEQEEVVKQLQAEYDDTATQNQNVVDIIIGIKNEFDTISEYADKLKRRYSEDEVLSMLSCIIVQYNADDNSYTLNPQFKIFENAESILNKHLHGKLDVSKSQNLQINDIDTFTSRTQKCYNDIVDFLQRWEQQYGSD